MAKRIVFLEKKKFQIKLNYNTLYLRCINLNNTKFNLVLFVEGNYLIIIHKTFYLMGMNPVNNTENEIIRKFFEPIMFLKRDIKNEDFLKWGS